nr:integrase, catalytic region, zinc finger, CCHC-type, peptidase aspartic, catalytic [Tanacetum cinerariifolium]
ESENQTENDCLVVEKEYDKEENPKVIAPGMFKLSVSQSVSPISISKTSCESNNVEIKLKIKRHTFSSVRRPILSSVVWKKKGSFNTSNVGLSAVSVLNLNRNVKRYSRKDLLACNNSHLGETTSAFIFNDAINVSCDSRMNDLLDDNNFFIFNDESVKISPVSKMPFRKKPRDSMNIYLWIIDSGCSKHMTGNRALLTNFMEKFLGTVRFSNNDFAVIASYGDVVIGSMTIKKVYYVKGLENNLFSVGQFCDKGLEVVIRKSTCFVRNEDGVDLLTGDRSTPQQNGIVERRNRTLVEAARTMLTFANLPSFTWAEAIATACFTQNRSIIHKRFDKTPYELMNKRKPNIKFFLVFGCRCYLLNDYEDVGKLKAKGDIGFVSKQYPNHVYALDKALYGLKQAPRAWYDVLLKFLIDSGFQKVPTSMVEQVKLKLDLVGKPVGHTDYRSMIGSSMYVTSSRPDIM